MTEHPSLQGSKVRVFPELKEVKLEVPLKSLNLSLIDTETFKQSLTEAHDILMETFSYLKTLKSDQNVQTITEITRSSTQVITEMTRAFEQIGNQFTQILSVLGDIQTFLSGKSANADLEREVLVKLNRELSK